MLPPGLGFNAISDKAIAASKSNKFRRSYWNWDEILKSNARGYWPYTPATNLLYGLKEAISMLLEEGLENVFARHARHAEGDPRRRARLGSRDPLPRSAGIFGVPDGRNHARKAPIADRAIVLDQFDMSLGAGLSKLWPTRCSASATSAISGICNDGHPGRREDGLARRRHSAQIRRGAGGDRLSRGQLKMEWAERKWAGSFGLSPCWAFFSRRRRGPFRVSRWRSGRISRLDQFIPGDPQRPLVVFIPGAHNTARIAMGAMKAGGIRISLPTGWLSQGYNFLGISYPIATKNPVMEDAFPDYNARDWGRQAADLAKQNRRASPHQSHHRARMEHGRADRRAGRANPRKPKGSTCCSSAPSRQRPA